MTPVRNSTKSCLWRVSSIWMRLRISYHASQCLVVCSSVLRSFREKAMAQFDSVKDQIDKLVVSIDSTAGLLNVRSEDYQDMYDKVRADYARLGMHVAAIKMRLSDIEDEKSRLGTSGDDPEKAEVLSLLEANHNVLQKRSDDLEVLRHAALQTLPTVRVIQFNNQSLIDKFNTIQRLTLPSWKRSFLLALAMDEQRGAVRVGQHC